MNELHEAELVAQAQQDAHAFDRLFERYVDRIYGYVRRQTDDEALAQDVTAATFEKALRQIGRFRWQGVSFGAWLYRIARNELIQQQRRRRWLTPLHWWQAADTHVEAAVQRREQQDQVQAALAKMPAKDREILTLRFYEDLSSAEVAVILNCSRNNVYVRVHRALQKLQQALEWNEQEVSVYVSN